MATKTICTDPMNDRFARVMTIFGWIGLGIVAVCGILYIFNLDPFITRSAAIANWGSPAGQFWEDAGVQTGGYTWLFDNFKYTDCLTMFGIAILAFAPLLSVLATIPRCAQKTYSFLMVIVSVELVFAITRPLIMAGAGG
jgi:hypothetical protein